MIIDFFVLFRRNSTLFIICIIIGLTSQSVACDYVSNPYGSGSQTYSTTDSCYSSASAALSACQTDHGSCTSHVINSPSDYDLNGALPVGTSYYFWISGNTFSIYWVTGNTQSCTTQRTTAAQQCGGDDKYDINETTCVATCKDACSSQRAAAAAECGGTNMYTMDASCNFTCTTNCDSEIAALKSQCGVGNYLIDHFCHGECKENCRDIARDACHGIYSPLGNDDPGMFPVKWYDDSTGECLYECRCDNYTGVDPYNTFVFDLCQSRPSDSPCDLNALKSNCLSKTLATINWETCDYTCDTCATVTSECVAKCPYGGRVPVCAEAYPSQAACICDDALSPPTDPSLPDGELPPTPDPDSYLPKTCAQHQAACNPSCSFACSSGADGFASNPRCDCSTASDPDPDDPDNPPPATDPESGDDTNGWLSSIKSNTDTLVDQLSDTNGWFEGLKHNSDISLDLDKDRNSALDNIAENARRSVDNQGKINEGVKRVGDIVSESGKTLYKINEGITGKGGVNERLGAIKEGITGEGGTNEKLQGTNERLSTIKEGITGEGGTNDLLGDMKDGLSNVGIGTQTDASLESLGGGGDVTGAGYGSAPTDSDLPTAEQSKSAFGTFTPRDDASGGYISQAKGALVAWRLTFSDETCHFQIPMERFNYTVDLNFCDYQQYFDMVGSLLVCLVALNEILSFV